MGRSRVNSQVKVEERILFQRVLDACSDLRGRLWAATLHELRIRVAKANSHWNECSTRFNLTNGSSNSQDIHS
eukprot:2529291-Amphidinium_carterae.1